VLEQWSNAHPPVSFYMNFATFGIPLRDEIG